MWKLVHLYLEQMSFEVIVVWQKSFFIFFAGKKIWNMQAYLKSER